MKILIMGATGNVGTPTVRALIQKGIRPVAAVRDIEKARKKLGDQVDYVHFDYLDPSTYEAAFEGVDRFFTIAAPPKKDPAITEALTKVAQDKGVELMVFLAGRTSGRIPGKPLYEIQQNLKASPLNTCVVEPSWFMQNYHSWMGTHLANGELPMPCGDGKIAFIDTADIGAVIAEVLTTEGHAGKKYEITGAKAYSNQETAGIFSELMEKEVKYDNVSLEKYIEKVAEVGWTRDMAVYTAKLFDLVEKGAEEVVTNEVENLLGRKPRSFQEFVKDEFVGV